nr:uncharacterized protein LOC107439748 [Parasteatoda tepidariorum]
MISNGSTFFCGIYALLLILNNVLGDPIKSSSAQDEEIQNKLATANNDLTFKLYSRLAKEEPGNVFFSPLSLSDALGMLFIGTGGSTQQELRTALGYNTANLPTDQVDRAFSSYLNKVLSSNKNYTLDLANKLLLKNSVQTKSTYVQRVQDCFKADVEKVDFAKNPKQILNEVNGWVKEKTHGKIDSILNSVDPSSVMLLLNAIYFKGAWTAKFEKKYTKPRKFYENGLDSEPKDIPFMDGGRARRYPYAEVEGTQALELPYKGEDISMIIILPGKRDGLSELEKELTLEKFKEFQNKLRTRFVYVKIPIFKIKYSHEMAGDIAALGAHQLFNGAADFSGITTGNGLEVSSILHKAIIEVNEEGSTAAAVTAIQIIPASPGPAIHNPDFTADHPFIFAIVDKRNDMVLFMGRVKKLKFSKMAILCAKVLKNVLLLLIVNVIISSASSLCTPSEMAHENLRKLAHANNDFGLKLYQRLADESSKNVFFSPLSLSAAFGMLFYGARGYTANELRIALGYERANLPSELVHSSFKQFLADTVPENNEVNPEYTLNLANAVLLAKQLNLVPQYKSDIQKLYNAIVQDVDFVKDAENINQGINTWVKAKTNNKIQSLFDKLDPSVIMVLLNAVYFKGTWKTQFQPEKTRPQKFYNGGSENGAKEVSMMNIKAKFPYTEVDDFQALELPYKGENISMIVLLPRQRDGLSSMEKSLTLEKLALIQRQLYRTTVVVSLPKFKIEYSKELSPDLYAIGAKSMFSAGSADFSGMTLDKNVFVSQVLHKAVVEVNEEGSEAAAVTGIVSNRMRPLFDVTPEFIADHPFMFAIVDRRSTMVLFAGRINDL